MCYKEFKILNISFIYIFLQQRNMIEWSMGDFSSLNMYYIKIKLCGEVDGKMSSKNDVKFLTVKKILFIYF